MSFFCACNFNISKQKQNIKLNVQHIMLSELNGFSFYFINRCALIFQFLRHLRKNIRNLRVIIKHLQRRPFYFLVSKQRFNCVKIIDLLTHNNRFAHISSSHIVTSQRPFIVIEVAEIAQIPLVSIVYTLTHSHTLKTLTFQMKSTIICIV